MDEDTIPPGRRRHRNPVFVEATKMLWTRSSLKGRVISDSAESLALKKMRTSNEPQAKISKKNGQKTQIY
jgi:hypothetical protein